MHEPEWSKYLFTSIPGAFKHVFNMNQKYNESLLDYYECLKQAKDILEEKVGK